MKSAIIMALVWFLAACGEQPADDYTDSAVGMVDNLLNED